MLTKKELKRFLNDIKVPIAPITDQTYLSHVSDLVPDFAGKLARFHYEVSESGDNFLELWDKWKTKAIEELQGRPKYKEFIKSDMSVWAPVVFPSGGLPNKSVFVSENNGSCFLSIDLRSANFQALKKVGVHTEDSWEEFIEKFTDSIHIKESKQFRSIIYGNLNTHRTQTIEKYLINEVRRNLEDLPDNYVLWSMMPDELIYEIKYNDVDLAFGNLEETIKNKTGIDVKTQQFQLLRRTISPVSGGKDIEFYEKRDVETKNKTVHCLGSPYYLLGLSLLKGIEPDPWDYVFINQEGYRCKIEEKFIINL